ncbi:MAG: restriction endonuclease subunit S [Sphingobium sp.]|nr:restriction endonuclease subunit S [Sphingobium sp.]
MVVCDVDWGVLSTLAGKLRRGERYAVNSASQRQDLPEGWVEATLGELGDWRGGGTPRKSEDQFWRDGTIPWVSPKDMKVSVVEDAQDKLNEAARQSPSFKLALAGSVLIVTRSGILQHSLPVAVTVKEVAFNQDLKALTPRQGIDARYVALYLRAVAQRFLDTAVKSGTTVESVDMGRLLAFPVRLAPTDEQRRIVAKLEPLLARCALVRADLERVKRLVSQQRRAAEIAAFRGRLAGAKRSNGSREPSNWSTVPLSSLIAEGPANGLSPAGVMGASGTLSLRLTATTSGVLRLDEAAVKRVNVTPPPNSRYWLRPGDLLIQRANALEHVGASAIFDGPPQTYIYPDLMMRIRIDDEITRRYVARYLNSPAARRYFRDHATGSASTMPKITGRILKELPVPLPPREQMKAVLAELDRLSGRLDAVMRDNQRCANLVDKLEQALLRKAFDGDLVDQRPDELPASQILSMPVRDKIPQPRRGRTKMPNRSSAHLDNVREYLVRRLEVWPSSGLAFDQVRADAPGSYEELKDLIFELISTNHLAQRYDSRERKMKLVKIA